jgi:hypothetical protein
MRKKRKGLEVSIRSHSDPKLMIRGSNVKCVGVLQAADATEAALAVHALRVEGGHLSSGTEEAACDYLYTVELEEGKLSV